MNTIVFGKLPTEGDYIRLGNDRALLDFLDTWLTAAWAEFMLTSDPRWEQHYRVSPLWWFAAPFENASVCGVICPSLDAVGRLFPIVVAARSPAADAHTALARASAWLNAVQEALIQVLEPPGQAATTLLATLAAQTHDRSESDMRHHVGLAGLQTLVAVESPSGWAALHCNPPLAGERNWSIWQSANFDGMATRALRLDGWPSAFALGVLLASGLEQLSTTPATPAAADVQNAVFRLEVNPGVVVLAAGAGSEAATSIPVLIQGSRGIAAVIPRAGSRLDARMLPIAVHDLLASIARTATQLHAAVEHLAHEVEAAVVICKLVDGWAAAEVGRGLMVDLHGSQHNHLPGESLRLRVWRNEAPPALQIDAIGGPESERRGVGALLGLKKTGSDRYRRLALIEPA